MRQWHNEPWRKLYTRIDGQWLRLSVTARGVADELLKYADEEGVLLALKEGEGRDEAVADLLSPKARERTFIVEAVADLFADTFLCQKGRKVTIRNFELAQERVTPAALRKRRQRDREQAEGVTETGTNAGQRRDQPRDKGVTAERDSHRDSHADVTRIETRRDETRRDKKPPSRDPGTPDATPGTAQPPRGTAWLSRAFEQATQRPVDVASCGILAPLVERAADLRGETRESFAPRLLFAAAELYADMRRRGVHHGTLTPGSLAVDPKGSGKYFAEACDIADGKRQARIEAEKPPPKKPDFSSPPMFVDDDGPCEPPPPRPEALA